MEHNLKVLLLIKKIDIEKNSVLLKYIKLEDDYTLIINLH